MPNYAKLFREAVVDSTRDFARDNPERISPGYWLGKFVKGGPDVPCAIWLCEHEPGDPGIPLDTGPIFIAAIGGEDCDPLDVVAMFERRPISSVEHAFRCADIAWAKEWGAASEPLKHPRRRVDIQKIKPIEP